MEFLDLGPIRSVRGSVRLPGSKSISNRFLLLAALAAGETHLHDVLDADDRLARLIEETLRGARDRSAEMTAQAKARAEN